MSRFISSLRSIGAWRWPLALVAAMTLSQAAFAAGLPTAPTSPDSGGSDMMHMMRGYLGWGIALLALVLCGMAFLTVGGGALAKFNEWRIGKAELGDLKALVVVGAIVLIVIVVLATQAIGVIATSGSFASS